MSRWQPRQRDIFYSLSSLKNTNVASLSVSDLSSTKAALSKIHKASYVWMGCGAVESADRELRFALGKKVVYV